jgi:hypothetical protein
VPLVLVAVATGCASVDPTDPSHFVDVLVRNDSSSAVQLVQCDTSCRTLHDRTTLPALGTTIINISNEGINVGYLVERLDGRKVGCLYMKYEHVKRRPTVPLSAMTRCR